MELQKEVDALKVSFEKKVENNVCVRLEKISLVTVKCNAVYYRGPLLNLSLWSLSFLFFVETVTAECLLCVQLYLSLVPLLTTCTSSKLIPFLDFLSPKNEISHFIIILSRNQTKLK